LWIMGKTGEGGHNATGEGGKFEIADVGPGTYTISAETLGVNSARLSALASIPNRNSDFSDHLLKAAEEGRGSAPLFGVTTVEVSGSDVDSIVIVLKPIPRVEAEFRVEGAGATDLKLGPIYFNRTDRITAMPMEMGQPEIADRRIAGDEETSYCARC
jgi:hypothetical protein